MSERVEQERSLLSRARRRHDMTREEGHGAAADETFGQRDGQSPVREHTRAAEGSFLRSSGSRRRMKTYQHRKVFTRSRSESTNQQVAPRGCLSRGSLVFFHTRVSSSAQLNEKTAATRALPRVLRKDFLSDPGRKELGIIFHKTNRVQRVFRRRRKGRPHGEKTIDGAARSHGERR